MPSDHGKYNRAEKSSDWLSAFGRSMEDGDATGIIGQCKAVRKITFLATPIVTPGHQPELRFSDAITSNSI